ncbi:Arm DNA-binding domain-containing protein [Micromonospora chalcea]|uniref:Arm DNA-binding domain-containing protein n=1 Tax=Micromonospora chalcea TaxID=1874 RepID=UPI0033F4CA3B
MSKTPAGTYRANWRDSANRQKAKTFRTKKEANAYLAEVEGAINRARTSTRTPGGCGSASS